MSFAAMIDQTVFNGQAADAHPVVGMIGNGSVCVDTDGTFLSTLRALLSGRIKFGERFAFREASIRSMVQIAVSEEEKNLLAVFYFPREKAGISQEQTSKAIEDALARNVGHRSFTRHQKTTDFFRKIGEVYLYVSAESRVSVLIAFDRTPSIFHAIQKAIPAALPWYFKPSERLSELETRLLRSLDNDTPNEYLAILEEIAKPYHLRESLILNVASQFLRYGSNSQIVKLKDAIHARQTEIMNWNEKIRETLETVRCLQLQLLGIETSVANSDDPNQSDFYRYLQSNQKITVIGSHGNGGAFAFVVQDRLSYFDPECAKRVIENMDANNLGSSVKNDQKENLRQILNGIFVSQEIGLNLCSAFEFHPTLGISPLKISSVPKADGLDRYLPNPHIDRFACMGGYLPIINEAMQCGDYIMVMEQCVASNKSLDLLDSVVRGAFARQLAEDSVACIHLPDGRDVRPSEAVKWLQERRNGND